MKQKVQRTFKRFQFHSQFQVNTSLFIFIKVYSCTSSLDQHLAVPLLKQIEKSIPGTLRNTQDIFGNNALWYLLYQEGNSADHTGRNYRVSSSESIEALLLEHGCNPNQANCLDLTYNSIRLAQKELNHFA